MHFGPALNVVSGNYVAAKRRGVVDGVDFGYTGEVRFVLKEPIRMQLENENIVLLSNLGAWELSLTCVRVGRRWLSGCWDEVQGGWHLGKSI